MKKRIGFKGMVKHPRYGAWSVMIYRCDNPNRWDYKHYGARGIKVCDAWYDFQTYLDDTKHLDFSDGMSIDRIDNDQGYFPENVRTTTKTQQAINQRGRKDNTSGGRGVGWSRQHNKWRARIWINGKRIHLGLFTDIDEAKKARTAMSNYRNHMLTAYPTEGVDH